MLQDFVQSEFVWIEDHCRGSRRLTDRWNGLTKSGVNDNLILDNALNRLLSPEDVIIEKVRKDERSGTNVCAESGISSAPSLLRS